MPLPTSHTFHRPFSPDIGFYRTLKPAGLIQREHAKAAQASVANAVQSPTTWPAAPGSIFSPQIIIDASNESVTFDVDGATRIRLIYRYEWAVYTDPEVYRDGNPGSAWRIAGDQFGGLTDTALTYEAVVGDHKTLTVRRFESNNVCLYGALIKFGNSPVEVLNLSRASASANLWNDWLTSSNAPEQTYSKLLKGFQPHLVILPSAGNDYFPPDGVTTQAQLNTRLDNLKAAVHALVAGVAIAIPTNPNITVNPGTPDEKDTATFNTWIRVNRPGSAGGSGYWISTRGWSVRDAS